MVEDQADSRNQKGTAIAFNYDSDTRRSRRRSRTPNKEAGEEKRKQQREKRKALFATPVTKPAAPIEESDDEQSESSGKYVAPRPDAWEKAAWEKSSFESSSEKSKFLRLMGGAKEKSGLGDKVESAQKVGPSSQELERQYVQGMQKQLYSRHRGLG
ncbi:unnamed protein product [Cladocopium goreaui]|uniref:Small acidic protein n=1 Tax=Cladocopium goreaui TaxID=2562237 RepID=A0A9P1GBX1_9DINO|nr:unnamed protein product [Cladocopium goreaui]|mmetsp:Transcript_13621/g.30106  ORF Transcript_13621/g.30106 Transcript_13621/m.30106 type:complete len:157 (+) Transcript_13621:48-518(+)